MPSVLRGHEVDLENMRPCLPGTVIRTDEHEGGRITGTETGM